MTIASGTNTAFLTWNAVAGADTYKVRRGVNPAGPFTLIASGLTGTSYLDIGLTPDTAFFYVIAAVNSSGDSPNSAVLTLSSETPPGTPTGLVAVPGQTSASLSWNPSFGAASYRVKRSLTRGGPYTTVASGLTSTTFHDAGLAASTTYYYVVVAFHRIESPNSNEADILTTGTLPAAPTGLAVVSGGTTAFLSWKGAPGADSYKVKRGLTPSGPFATIADNVTALSYNDNTVSPDSSLFYVVSGVNSSGEGPNSTVVNFSGDTPPGTPDGLLAFVDQDQITLIWNPSLGAASYRVKRSTNRGGPYTTVASGLSGTIYTDTGLSPTTAYYYVVASFNRIESPNSNEATATTQRLRPRMSISKSGSNVAVFWNAPDVYNLETAASLNGVPVWTLVPGTRLAGANTVILPATGGQAYFRLRSP